MKRAVVLLALLTAACGGGGGAPSVPAEPAPDRSIGFGYYGTGEGQLAATSASVSFVHADDFGAGAIPNESITLRQIAQMQEARARGVKDFVLSVGYVTFDAQCNYLGMAGLLALKARLDALDLGRSVSMLIFVDEPDMHDCSGASMAQAFMDGRKVWPVAIGVIYGDHATPGIDQATDVGTDRYNDREDALLHLPNLRADQRLMLVVGGANPYRQDSAPFVAYAKAHANVSRVWAFLFVGYTDPDGQPQQGIGGNGMLAQYAACGCQLTLRC